ncbi:MAG: LPS export ABC transporter periplasmic protein LptC [Pseudomonadales bacterium]|nr:LPS export ABC transporter periplasmic protein LptC [Pseudomonadales bacterium]MDG1444348.1 LPS export ABC transporter periplasmic protein LptC [Pseudomonadales bacterium]
MINSRNLIFLVFVLIVAFAINYISESETLITEKPTFAKNDPDLYMLKANILQYNNQGTKQHRIKADRLTHFPLTDITTLVEPNIMLYPTERRPEPWDITSRHGRLLPQVQVRDEVVELWDHVLAIRNNSNGNFIQIQTESLTVYPDKDYAETNQKVFIDENSGRTIAGGMKAYLDEGKFFFSSSPDTRVRTIMLPAFK